MASPPPHPAAVGDDSVSVPVVSSSNPTSNVASAVTRLGSVFRRAISPQISQTQHTTQLEAIPRMQPQTSSQSLNQGGNPAISESANSAEAVLPQPPLPCVPEQHQHTQVVGATLGQASGATLAGAQQGASTGCGAAALPAISSFRPQPFVSSAALPVVPPLGVITVRYYAESKIEAPELPIALSVRSHTSTTARLSQLLDMAKEPNIPMPVALAVELRRLRTRAEVAALRWASV